METTWYSIRALNGEVYVVHCPDADVAEWQTDRLRFFKRISKATLQGAGGGKQVLSYYHIAPGMFINLRTVISVQPVQDSDDSVKECKAAFEKIEEERTEAASAANLEEMREEMRQKRTQEEVSDESPRDGEES